MEMINMTATNLLITLYLGEAFHDMITTMFQIADVSLDCERTTSKQTNDGVFWKRHGQCALDAKMLTTV